MSKTVVIIRRCTAKSCSNTIMQYSIISVPKGMVAVFHTVIIYEREVI